MNILQKYLLLYLGILSSIMFLTITPVRSMQNQDSIINKASIEKIVDQKLSNLTGRIKEIHKAADNTVMLINKSMGVAHGSNKTSIDAFKRSKKNLESINRTTSLASQISQEVKILKKQQAHLTERAQQLKGDLRREYTRLREKLSDQARVFNVHCSERALEKEIKLNKVIIDEQHKRGIFEMKEKIRADASVRVEEEKWKQVRALVSDPKIIIQVVLALSALALSVYTIKYAIPALIKYFSRPIVISETSHTSWFEWESVDSKVALKDLVFNEGLEKQLVSLCERIKSAQTYNENLPNILLYGPSGTGKTDVARAIAYHSGLEYALTSGSEFAKITNLDDANNELRKLLTWANSSSKGLIVFIDEAESLFADRTLPTTPKATQDFINTFLSLIPNASQKNVMFILATNHPFKLDDAVTSRIGITIPFPLPEKAVRKRILMLYLKKYAQEDPQNTIILLPEVLEKLSDYADQLEGLSPRSIKFIAQEMIVRARRLQDQALNKDVASSVLAQVKSQHEEKVLWDKERNNWINNHVALAARY